MKKKPVGPCESSSHEVNALLLQKMTAHEQSRPPDRLAFDQAARIAAGFAFPTFKSWGEANEWAHRHGAVEKVMEHELEALHGDARSCHWCGKSLGSKLNACFSHIQPVALGHPHSIANTCISCQACARARVAMLAVDPNEFRDARRLRAPHGCAVSGFTPSMEDRLGKLHNDCVYVVRGNHERPWVFLTYGLPAYEDRLRHLTLSHQDSRLALHTSSGKAPSFKGIVVHQQPTGERFLREVRRAGLVKMLEAEVI